jgi:hypothetical protein
MVYFEILPQHFAEEVEGNDKNSLPIEANLVGIRNEFTQ